MNNDVSRFTLMAPLLVAMIALFCCVVLLCCCRRLYKHVHEKISRGQCMFGKVPSLIWIEPVFWLDILLNELLQVNF